MDLKSNDNDKRMTHSNQQEYLSFKLILEHLKSMQETLEELKLLYQNQDGQQTINSLQDYQTMKNQNTDDVNSSVQINPLNFKNANDYKINLRKFIEVNKKLNNRRQKQENDQKMNKLQEIVEQKKQILQNNNQVIAERLKNKETILIEERDQNNYQQSNEDSFFEIYDDGKIQKDKSMNKQQENKISDSQQSNIDKFQRQNNLENPHQKLIFFSFIQEGCQQQLQRDSNKHQIQQETNMLQNQDDLDEENIKEMSIVDLVQSESFEKQIQIDSDAFQESIEDQIEQSANIIEIQDESDADKFYLKSGKKQIQYCSDEQQIFDKQIVDNYEENSDDQIQQNSIVEQIQQEESNEDQIKQQSVMVQNQSENNKEQNNKQLCKEKCQIILNDKKDGGNEDLIEYISYPEKSTENYQSVQTKKSKILDLNQKKINSLIKDQIDDLQEKEPKHQIQNLIYLDGLKNQNITNNQQINENSYEIKSVWNNLMENKTNYKEFQRSVQNYQNDKNLLPLYFSQNFSFEKILPQQKDDKITEKDQEYLQKLPISQFQPERNNHPNAERILHKKKEKDQKQNVPFNIKLQTMVEEERNKNIQDNSYNSLKRTKIMEKNQQCIGENDKEGEIIQDDEQINKLNNVDEQNQKLQFFKNLLDTPNNNLSQEKQKLQQLVSCIDRLQQFQTQQTQLSTEYLNLFNDTMILKKSMNPQIQQTIEQSDTKNSQNTEDLDGPMTKINDQQGEQSQQTAEKMMNLQNKVKIEYKPIIIKQKSSQKPFVSKYVEDLFAQILKSPQEPLISQNQVDPIHKKIIIEDGIPKNQNIKKKRKNYRKKDHKKVQKKIIEDESYLNLIEKMQKVRYDIGNDANSEQSCQQQYYEDKDGYELPIWNQDLGKMVSRYVCKACKRSLFSLNSLKNHCNRNCRILQQKYAYYCQYCQKGFRYEIKKLNHQIKHGNVSKIYNQKSRFRKIKVGKI